MTVVTTHQQKYAPRRSEQSNQIAMERGYDCIDRMRNKSNMYAIQDTWRRVSDDELERVFKIHLADKTYIFNSPDML